jgi:hypothetical protein
MFGIKILLLLFLICPEIRAFSQTLYLLPLKVNHVKDSVVEIEVDEKENGIGMRILAGGTYTLLTKRAVCRARKYGTALFH